MTTCSPACRPDVISTMFPEVRPVVTGPRLLRAVRLSTVTVDVPLVVVTASVGTCTAFCFSAYVMRTSTVAPAL